MKAAHGPVTEIRKVASRSVCRLVIELPIEAFRAAVASLDDQPVLVTVAPAGLQAAYGIIDGEPDASEQRPPADYGHAAAALMRNGFFRAPPVWKAVGSDADYQAWCRRQPCVVTGNAVYDDQNEPWCEYAHVRRIEAGAGTATKPEYSGVPLHPDVHRTQHQQGEAAALRMGVLKDVQPGEAKRWFSEAAMAMVEKWAREALRAQLGHSSWRNVPPAKLNAWCERHGLTRLLPREYREQTNG